MPPRRPAAGCSSGTRSTRASRAQRRAPPDGHRRHLPRRRRSRLGAAGAAHPRPRDDRPGDRDRPAARPLRPPHRPLAALLLAAEGGLDHRAPHERRRRRLGRPLAGDADPRLERHPPARRGDRAPHRRLAARAHRLRRPAAGAHPLALVPARLARRERRDCATGSAPSPRRSPSRWPGWRSCRRSTASAASRPSSTR